MTNSNSLIEIAVSMCMQHRRGRYYEYCECVHLLTLEGENWNKFEGRHLSLRTTHLVCFINSTSIRVQRRKLRRRKADLSIRRTDIKAP